MYHEFAQILNGTRWLMEPHAFAAMIQRAEKATPEEIQAAVAAYGQRDPGPKLVGDVAVIEVGGPIMYKPSWFSMYFGGGCVLDLQSQFRAALNDPSVRTVLFKMDSPGGTVDMVSEFADEIYAARGEKPILAVADTLIASAAYWLAASVDTIYATTSSQLGSIGVYCGHADYSGALDQAGIKITLIAHGDHKVDANPYEALTDQARADLQASVDEIGDWFETAVARGRGVKKSEVLASFGQGKVFRGKEAISLGLADKMGTFNQVLSRLTKGRASTAAARATATPTQIADAAVNGNARTVTTPKAGPAVDRNRDDVCQACGENCPCTEPECPDDCDTCDPECACMKGKAKASVAPVPAADDDTEEQEILAALSE